MVELKQDKLIFSFPEIHPNAVCQLEFQRTLRIPDDNNSYPLPPGLGRFALEHVEDHADKLPETWQKHGGVLLPMYQSEALWINFSSRAIGHNEPYPFAVKIATGKINAVTGESWQNNLIQAPQDYVVVPEQPWLDGYCVQKGLIRQFVAMPQGHGFTTEEQISGHAEHGGLQIIVYPMKRTYYNALQQKAPPAFEMSCCYLSDTFELGLAPGGLMRQEVYEDPYDFDVWEQTIHSRCFVHILNSQQWHGVTGRSMPQMPPSAKEYTQAGLPWFEYYDDQNPSLTGSTKLAGLDSVAAASIKQGKPPLGDNQSLSPQKVQTLTPATLKVKDGQW